MEPFFLPFPERILMEQILPILPGKMELLSLFQKERFLFQREKLSSLFLRLEMQLLISPWSFLLSF